MSSAASTRRASRLRSVRALETMASRQQASDRARRRALVSNDSLGRPCIIALATARASPGPSPSRFDNGRPPMTHPQQLLPFTYDLPDVQGSIDQRHLAIQRVGIKGVRHPITVRDARGATQQTVGTWSLDVHLPETRKGTHMSRFVALMEERTAAAASRSRRCFGSRRWSRARRRVGPHRRALPVLHDEDGARVRRGEHAGHRGSLMGRDRAGATWR